MGGRLFRSDNSSSFTSSIFFFLGHPCTNSRLWTQSNGKHSATAKLPASSELPGGSSCKTKKTRKGAQSLPGRSSNGHQLLKYSVRYRQISATLSPHRTSRLTRNGNQVNKTRAHHTVAIRLKSEGRDNDNLILQYLFFAVLWTSIVFFWLHPKFWGLIPLYASLIPLLRDHGVTSLSQSTSLAARLLLPNSLCHQILL